MLEIIPGILEKDWPEIERKINLVRPFAKTIHVDIIDGKFVENPTFLDPGPFAKYTGDIFFELHMMVENPLFYLRPFAEAGFKRFIGHVEKMSDQTEFVIQGKSFGEVGLAFDDQTGMKALRVPFDDLDVLLIMTIKAGFSGQQCVVQNFEKVKNASAKFNIPIEVDGGINEQNILLSKSAGAQRVVVNSFLFEESNPYEQYRLLEQKYILMNERR